MSDARHEPPGTGLLRLDGYPFEVRHSVGARDRARTMAELAADAYLGERFGDGAAPDLALIVADAGDWPARRTPYGLPYFSDEPGHIRPGVVVMSATAGGFQTGIVEDLLRASPRARPRLRATYPDADGTGIDLQPFFDLITIHELGHAYEVLGDLRLPADWLSEIMANLALHAFVATRRPRQLPTLEVLPTIGAGSRRLAARWRTEGHSTLEALDAHYTGGRDPMDPRNYAVYQYRFQRLAARVLDADGEAVLTRLWAAFHARDHVEGTVDAGTRRTTLARLLTREVSPTLGRAVRDWR